MQSKLLTREHYQEYFSFQEPETGFRIGQEPESQENYVNFQIFLPKTFFDLDHPAFLLNPFLNTDAIPEKIHLNFELFGIGAMGKEEVFIFKPWVINVANPIMMGFLENFHLYMPSTLFYNLIERLIFLEQLSIEHFPYIRILQDIPQNTFKRFGLDRNLNPNEVKTSNLKIRRILNPDVSQITTFYEKNWEGISANLRNKYFRPSLNTWFEILKKGFWGDSIIGYLRLYNTSSSFTGGISIEYIIDRNQRKKGYATEATVEMVGFLKKYSYAVFLGAEVNKNNYASIRVLEKVGFIETSSSPLQRDNYIFSLIDKLEKLEKGLEEKKIELSIKNEYLNRYRRYFE